jgi:PIN domain nuclease of toxin-antitoxin system
VLDASAILAISNRERGHAEAAKYLPGSLISAVNLSEVYAKAIDKGSSLEDFARYLNQLPLTAVPFDAEQAAVAATFRAQARKLDISFADTACLALGLVSGLPVVTGEGRWRDLDIGVELKIFR